MIYKRPVFDQNGNPVMEVQVVRRKSVEFFESDYRNIHAELVDDTHYYIRQKQEMINVGPCAGIFFITNRNKF